MAGAVNDHEFAVRPGLGQFPRGNEWGRKIEAAVYEDAGDTSQRACLLQQNAVFEPGPVQEKMRYNTRERQLEDGL